MVSNFGYIPQLDSSRILRRNEVSKDKLASAIQCAVTQVQNRGTLRNADDPLRTDLAEVWHLCDCLDKAFLHGLRSLEIGYWPFVKEFTHQDVQLQIQMLNYVQSSLGRSRAWLCLSLNEATLEGYVNSFIQNPKLVEKHYLQPALLRDVQRMQLVLTLMAGLENIKFELLVDSSFLDTQGFVYMGGIVEKDSDADTLSLGSCGPDSATVTPVSTKSIVDDDSGVLSIEIETATEASTDVGTRSHSRDRNCSCNECSHQFTQRERISHLIGLEPAVSSDDSGEVSLEVVHTKILRRRKTRSVEGRSHSLNLESTDIDVSDVDSSEDYAESNDGKVPCDDDSHEKTEAVDLLGEREAPEGQEDPPDVQCGKNGLKEASPQASEELSIYDHLQLEESRSLFHEMGKRDPKWPSVTTSEESDRISAVSYEEEVARGNVANAAEDLSLKVDGNAKLYLMLEVFLKEGEQLYKMFLTSIQYSDGSLHDIFLLLSNTCLYILSPGDESEKFKREAHISFEELDCITVDLNYQGFQLFAHKKEIPYHICTGSEQLTRNILSHLEVIIRRSKPLLLPAVSTDMSATLATLRKKVQSELSIKEDSVMLHHFVLISWENYMGASPLSTPTGALHSGFLMYMHTSRETSKWNPGYFLLKGGYLYCFADSTSRDPLFYFQLSAPRFRGCHRDYTVDRPHAFQLLLHGGNESLVLAAANENEVSLWLQAILQTVTIADQIRDLEPCRLITPCFLLIANNYFLTLLDETRGSQVIGRASLNDLIAVRMDTDFPTCCVMEFESGEANSCSGEWILLFADEDEREKFVAIAKSMWEELFEVPLTVAEIKDLSLWGRCRERFQNQERTKESLMALCLDS